MIRTSLVAVVLPLVAALAGCRFYAEARSDSLPAALDEEPARRGVQRFAFDDFGGLSTETLRSYAAPWKLVAVALLDLDGGEVRTEARAVELLARYGYFVPESVGNWPRDLPAPTWTGPIGLIRGVVDGGFPHITVDATTNGCASCHGGHLWDAEGNPTRTAWLGLPNTSFDNQGYVADLLRAFRVLLERSDDDILAEVERVFPDVSRAELATLRSPVLSLLRRNIGALDGRDSLVAYPLGGPGYTNGVASVKFLFGALEAPGAAEAEVALTSIPDLGSRHLRSSLLYDGVYAPPGTEPQRPMTPSDVDAAHLRGMGGIPAVFTLSTMGVTPERALANVDGTRDIYTWLAGYQPPPFPGVVDVERAARGEALYRRSCASCHGTYAPMDGDARPLPLEAFPNALIPQRVIGTDPARAEALDEELRRLFASELGTITDTHLTGGYVAPPLSALWATAPYLHNGSVPTLWHLMHPAERPTTFQLGGHRLDYARVGIHLDDEGRYPAGYEPWSRPATFDTRRPGLSAVGHEGAFQLLDEDAKGDLLEYLKLL